MKTPIFFARYLSLFSAVILGSTLVSALLAAQPSRAEISPPPSLQLLASETTASGLTLMREDLPAGFTELPPAIREQLTAQVRAISQQLGGADLDPDNLAVFVNPRNFQIVMGFTGKLETPATQAEFDANLKKIEDPEVQKLVLATIKQKLTSFPMLGNLEVNNLSLLSERGNLGNASTGVTLDIKLQGQNFRIDLMPFRRNDIGAVTAVLYPQPGASLSVRTFADKLDRRIVDR